MFTPAELAAEHARAMRIVKAVLAACDARAATARAARAEGFKEGDAPWVLAIGKAAIGMAEGMKDVCGEPRRHLIVTVDGPAPGSLANIVRSDHPLPTQRSLDAGQAVKRFIEQAKAAGAPALTVLISGGASSLICEPIPGIELEEYRDIMRRLIQAGMDIEQLNTVRRATDTVKGGGLARCSAPLAVDLFMLSDVPGDGPADIGSGPFVPSPTTPADAADRLIGWSVVTRNSPLARWLLQAVPPFPVPPPRTACIVASNDTAAAPAAAAALGLEGLQTAPLEPAFTGDALQVVNSLLDSTLPSLKPKQAVVWGGEWRVDVSGLRQIGHGGRMQFTVAALAAAMSQKNDYVILGLATDGVDGTCPRGSLPAAGAIATSHTTALMDAEFGSRLGRQTLSDSYGLWQHLDAGTDLPPGVRHQVFTGPTGTNVNDLLIAWRAK